MVTYPPTFAAIPMLQSLQEDLVVKRKKQSKTDINGVFTALKGDRAKVFGHAPVPCEPAVENSAIYKAFKIGAPTMIPWELSGPG